MNPLRCERYIWFFLICLLCHLSHGSDMRMSFLVPLHIFCSLHSSSRLYFSASIRVPSSIITAVLPFYSNTGSWVNDFKFGTLPSVMAVFCFLWRHTVAILLKDLTNDLPLHLVTGSLYFYCITYWIWTWFLLIVSSYSLFLTILLSAARTNQKLVTSEIAIYSAIFLCDLCLHQ